MCKRLDGLIATGLAHILCRSMHLRYPTSSHPATIQRDGPGLSGERARRHHSCPCHPPATSLTTHVHVTRVAPTGHDAAASVAAGAEENADDDGDDVPALAPSCPDVPAGARHFLLRPQRLTRLSVFSRARRSPRLPAPIDRACVPVADVRLRAGTRVSPRFSKGRQP
jgi:hypothetical protein